MPLAARGAWEHALHGLPPPVLLRALDALAPIRAGDGPETPDVGHAAVLPVFDRDRAVALIALSGRATAFIGPALIAVVTAATGSQRLGVSPVILLFLIGLVLLYWVKTEDEQPGNPLA